MCRLFGEIVWTGHAPVHKKRREHCGIESIRIMYYLIDPVWSNPRVLQYLSTIIDAALALISIKYRTEFLV